MMRLSPLLLMLAAACADRDVPDGEDRTTRRAVGRDHALIDGIVVLLPAIFRVLHAGGVGPVGLLAHLDLPDGQRLPPRPGQRRRHPIRRPHRPPHQPPHPRPGSRATLSPWSRGRARETLSPWYWGPFREGNRPAVIGTAAEWCPNASAARTRGAGASSESPSS